MSGNPDIVFLSYDEPQADRNFLRLKTFAPDARRVHGVRGILEAYKAAAEIAQSPFFFAVEADNWILDGFEFKIPETLAGARLVLWQTANPVNRLRSYFGSVKLIERNAILTMGAEAQNAVDFFLAMNASALLVERIASETRFNTTPFLAWRAGFRECAKFTGGGIRNGPGTRLQLEAWQTLGRDRPNGNWCILGARMGARFGSKHRGTDALVKINDVEWLRQRFNAVAKVRTN